MGANLHQNQNMDRTASEQVSLEVMQAIQAPPPPPPPHVRSTCTPLGLIAFGMCGFMMTFLDTEWAPAGFAPVVVAYASVFAGLAEFIAGLFELIRGHTFAGTAFGSYGCFWMGLYVWKMMEINATVPAVAEAATKGYTLWCGLWGFLSFFFFLCTLRASNSLQFLFFTVALFFWLSCGASYNHNCFLAAGYVLMCASMSAIYGAFGMLFEEAYGWQLPFMKATNYI